MRGRPTVCIHLLLVCVWVGCEAAGLWEQRCWGNPAHPARSSPPRPEVTIFGITVSSPFFLMQQVDQQQRFTESVFCLWSSAVSFMCVFSLQWAGWLAHVVTRGRMWLVYHSKWLFLQVITTPRRGLAHSLVLLSCSFRKIDNIYGAFTSRLSKS